MTKRSLRLHKKAFLLGAGVISLIAYTNCSGGFTASNNTITASSIAGAANSKLNLVVKDASGAVIYDDSNPNSSLVLKAGQNYTFSVRYQGSLPAGTTVSLKYTDISSIGALPQSISLNIGDNVISGSTFSQGNYALEFDTLQAGTVTSARTYNAAVSCPNPTFTASSLNGAAISATANGSNNMFDFSVAGVVGSANGMAPYECALDPTGTSIIDTTFQPCSQVFQKVYSNFVANRNVHVVVRDACNIAQSVSKVINLPYSIPAMGVANVFISGQTSGATGMAVGDQRVDNVTYLATNQAPTNIDVQSSVNGPSFTIQSAQNYRQASSVNFGIKLTLAGLVNTVNVAAGTGSVDASNATVQSVTYSTDEAGGSQVALSFSSSSCTLSNQGARVTPVAGPPCTTAGGGDQNQTAIEVWGHYNCTALSNSGGTINLQGDFDGISLKVDSCIGGGGGGGGGVVPISL